MIKYIAYCRKSTDEKDKQVLSIESQIEEIKEFAQRENLQIVKFITESKTAKVPGRVEFNHLIQLIETGEIQGILAWHPFMSTSFSFIGECRQRPLPILSWFYTRLVLVFERLKHPIGQLAFKAPQRPQLCFALG